MEMLRMTTKTLARRGPAHRGGVLGCDGPEAAAVQATLAARAARVADAFIETCRLVAQGRLRVATALDDLARWCPCEPPHEPAIHAASTGGFTFGCLNARRCEYWMAAHLEFARHLVTVEDDFCGSSAAQLLAVAIDRSLIAARALRVSGHDVHPALGMGHIQARCKHLKREAPPEAMRIHVDQLT